MSDNNPNNGTSYFHGSVELADLGRERFDQDTAEATDRDYALNSHRPVIARAGRAPRGLEDQVFQWNTFQYTTDETNGREELKGDLHGGQLHRENRAARDGPAPMGGGGYDGGMRGGGGRGRGGGGRGGRSGGARDDGRMDALCAGRKPQNDAPPLAKGIAEEMDKSMFWDGPIV